MIKTLRHRFIAIAMLSTTLVLLIIIGSINIINYQNINRMADLKLSMLAEEGGTIPQFWFQTAPSPKPSDQHISPEAPFDTRFFTVTLNDSGVVLSTDTQRIAAVSSTEILEEATWLMENHKTSGYWNQYKYVCVEHQSNQLYIFLDCSRELDTFQNFLWASICISCIGLFMVFLLVLFLSHLALRPVEESYTKQKQFITDASHELKTPLTIIDANTEILEINQGENEWTGSIHRQISRLSDLTNKLVFLSRMDEEDRKLPMVDFSLTQAVCDLTEPYRALAESQGYSLTADIDQDITYCGNEEQIRNAITQLLDNALKYTVEKGTIHLSLRRNGRTISFTLTNSAASLEAGNYDMLFERFYRLDHSRNSSTGGHGIGLSVVKAIVHAHKGKIHAYSKDGSSMTIQITL